MPKKIRELITELRAAGFIDYPGKGSHRNFKKNGVLVTISGKTGADAKPYQEKAVKKALEQVKK